MRSMRPGFQTSLIALFAFSTDRLFEILRFAQDDSGERTLDVRIEVQKWIYPSNNFLR